MKLTRAASYALHAVVHLASQKQPAPALASHTIARLRGIPERFLLKVLKPLVSARVLTSIKGPNGGYKLARTAKQISLLEIVEAIDGPVSAGSHADDTSSATFNTRLETICQDTADHVRKHLGKIAISDLLKKK